MRVIIFANGELGCTNYADDIIQNNDFILACDGGLRHCHVLNITPNYIIGDLDSADAGMLSKYPNVPVKDFPAEKDFTDLELSVNYACDMGAESIIILGGLGGRVDHMLANVHVTAQAAERGVPAEITDERTKITVINNSREFDINDGKILTLLPLTTTADGIKTSGLKYPLNGESLKTGFAKGVSNEIINDKATVSVKKGLLAAIQIKD